MEEFENIEKQLSALEPKEEPQTVDFIVDGTFVKQLPQIISNIDKIKETVARRTEADRHLILTTEEDFDNAKKRCAELNKVATSIEAKRKEVKKAYNQPLEIFESKLKETVEIITSAKDNLWSQVKQAEADSKQRLEDGYKKYYLDNAGNEVLSYRSWEKIFDTRWLNKGVKADEVITAINSIIENVRTELSAIDGLKSEFAPSLYERYKQGATITDIIAYNNRLLAEKTAIEQRKVQEVATTQNVANKPIETAQQVEVPKQPETQPVEDVITIDFRIWATKTQLNALKDFLVRNNIKYGKVPDKE